MCNQINEFKTVGDIVNFYGVSLKQVKMIWKTTTVKQIIADRLYGNNDSFNKAENLIKAAVIIRECR